MKDKLLYELELELNEERKRRLNLLMYNEVDIKLREVLDLGFDCVFIDGIILYKDTDGDYMADGYVIPSGALILEADIDYVSHELETNECGSYLHVHCKLNNPDLYKNMLVNVANGREEEGDE